MGALSTPPRRPGTPAVDELGWFDVDTLGTAGAARRAAVKAAERLGFDQTRVAEISIVLAEIGSNLRKYAGRGQIAVRSLRCGTRAAVEVVAVDHGPGIADLELSSRDGHSTAGTLGAGLGAVVRLSSRADMYSLPGRGTVVTARFWPREPAGAQAREPASVQWPPAEGATRPMVSEQVCGDRFSVRVHPGGPLLLVADGLGHGPLAATAAAAAVDAFQTTDLGEPAAIVKHLHHRLLRGRGAAVAVAGLDLGRRTVRFAGVGNIAGFVASSTARRGMASLPGIVGVQTRTVREFSYPLEPGSVVVLHSDGLTDRWHLPAYPGLTRHSSLVIAATLLRDAGKQHDDACVLVAKATS